MSRPVRIQFPGAYYHVMNRGLARRATFVSPADHEGFLTLLDDIATRWQVRVHAYCCMTNHYHLLLQTPLGNLARVMRHLDGIYTQRFNRAYHRDGPLFRGRYKAILIDAETYLLQVVRYIHLNPVAAGLTHDPGAYPWSSHRLYRQPTPPAWLAQEEVLATFPDLPAFERFVAEGNEEALEAFYARRRWSPVLGDEAFIAWALAVARRSREHPRAQQTPQFSTVGAVARAVCQHLGRTAGQVLTSRRGRANLARSLAIYIASRTAGFSHPEIKQYFAVRTDSAITKTCDRTHRLITKTPHLHQLLRAIIP